MFRLFGSKGKKNSHFTDYVALGDSVLTDDYPGQGKGAASLLFRNQDRQYPDYCRRDLTTRYPGTKFHLLARDGATTLDIVHDQISALDRLRPGCPVFTVSGGGNDILQGNSEPEDIAFRLQAVMAHLRRQWPRCTILLCTIYDPTDGAGDLIEPGKRMDKEMGALLETNRLIRRMADASGGGIRLVDVYNHFLGHGQHCKDPGNAYHHPDDPSLWYVLSIEPNTRGAHEIRRLFWSALHEEDETGV